MLKRGWGRLNLSVRRQENFLSIFQKKNFLAHFEESWNWRKEDSSRDWCTWETKLDDKLEWIYIILSLSCGERICCGSWWKRIESNWVMFFSFGVELKWKFEQWGQENLLIRFFLWLFFSKFIIMSMSKKTLIFNWI